MIETNHSESSSKNYSFDSDRPISKRIEDAFGWIKLAESIADAMRGWQNREDSLVVGICGHWGSGKTSLMNLVIESLKEKKNAKPNKPAPYIVDFNPWQWSSQKRISETFFHEIGMIIEYNQSGIKGAELSKKWWEYAATLDFGDRVETRFEKLIPFLLIIAGAVLGSSNIFMNPLWTVICISAGIILFLSQAAEDKLTKFFIKRETTKHQSFKTMYDEIKNLMSEARSPLLVVLDDIDRLCPQDLMEVFQLIQTNANFPNIIYILLFQRSTIEENIRNKFGENSSIDGREYLEKIVNVCFDLPAIEPNKIANFIDNKINLWFISEKISESEKRRFIRNYWNTLHHFFHDLRDIKRFFSTFAFHAALLKERGELEINLVDLFSLEILRTFEPAVYRKLRRNKTPLTRISDRTDESQRQEVQEAVDEILSEADKLNHNKVREIIEQIFPRAEIVHETRHPMGVSRYDRTFEQEWRRNLRVCHPDIFDRYFFLRLTKDDTSRADIKNLIRFASSRKRSLKTLRSLNENEKLSSMIRQLHDFYQEISIEAAEPFISAFLDIGDEISGRHDMSFTSPVLQPGIFICQLLKQKQLDKTECGNLLLRAARLSDGVFLVVWLAQINDREDGDTNEPKNDRHFLIDKESSERLKNLAVERMKEAAISGALIKREQLAYLLRRWQAWDKTEESKGWLRSRMSSNQVLPRILVAFLSKSSSMSMGDNVERVHWKFDLMGLEKFITEDDLNTIELHVNQLSDSHLNEMEKLAVDRFRRMLTRKRAGRPYDLEQIWHEHEDEDNE